MESTVQFLGDKYVIFDHNLKTMKNKKQVKNKKHGGD